VKKEEGEEVKGEPDYDPFTGLPLRRLIPLQASLPSLASTAASSAEPSLSHQLWAHLATVRRLQAELAAQHISMENVTGRSGKGGREAGGGGERPGAARGEIDLSARRQAGIWERRRRGRGS